MDGNVGLLTIAASRVVDARTDPRKRQSEFDRLQRLVLRFARAETEGHSTERAAELAGIDPDWLRAATLSLVRSLTPLATEMLASDWIIAARSALGVTAASTDRDTIAGSVFVRTPPNSAAKTIGQVIGAQAGAVAVAHSSIHKAKGSEAPAVLVVVPPDRAPSTRTADLITAWESGAALEAKRVLYVGVTRAQRVCVLAVPNCFADRLVAILKQNAVPLVSSHV